MSKPTPYQGKRTVPLIQATAQVASEASQTAADATTPEWGNVQNKPSVFPPDTHNHDSDYVELTGDAMTGDLSFDTDAKGVILIDRTTTTQYRLFVDNGVLGIETV